MKCLELSYFEFLDLCILSGCDYCKNIKGVGPHKALHNIKKYKNIESIVENMKNVNIEDDYIKKVIQSRKLFAIYKDTISLKNMNIIHNKIDIEKLKLFLIDDCLMSKTRVEKSLLKLNL